MTEELTLNVDGKVWGGWTDMTINRSLESVAGEFDLTVTARWSSAAPRSIKPGQSCTVSIGSDRVMTGYIDDFIPSYDAENVSLRVMGRDKTGDLVDSSVVDKSGQWKGQKLEQLAATICKPYGIEVVNETDTGDAFGSITLEQGETGFELLDRLAKQRGVLVTSDAYGRLVITRASTLRAGVALTLGDNILAARGRSSARGEWHKAYVLGESNTTEITVAGWRENGINGPLWQTNRLVKVTDAIQQLDVTWLIKTVSFMEGDSGRLTVLTLAPPESLDMPSQKAKAKGKKAKSKTTVGATWD